MIRRTLGWIERINKEYNIQSEQVLDIGSLDRNGNPRHLFLNSIYTGIDIREGENVDIVLSAYEISSYFEEDYFDTVLCLYVLEHLKDIFVVLDGIDIVLKRGGYFYLSVPNVGFPKHNYPKDYWRFTEEAVREVIMQGYNILSLDSMKTDYMKHPIINCLGIKI